MGSGGDNSREGLWEVQGFKFGRGYWNRGIHSWEGLWEVVEFMEKRGAWTRRAHEGKGLKKGKGCEEWPGSCTIGAVGSGERNGGEGLWGGGGSVNWKRCWMEGCGEVARVVSTRLHGACKCPHKFPHTSLTSP